MFMKDMKRMFMSSENRMRKKDRASVEMSLRHARESLVEIEVQYCVIVEKYYEKKDDFPAVYVNILKNSMENTAKQKDAVSAEIDKLESDLTEWKDDIVVLTPSPTCRKKVRAQRFNTLSSSTLSSNVHDIMDDNDMDENGNAETVIQAEKDSQFDEID